MAKRHCTRKGVSTKGGKRRKVCRKWAKGARRRR